MRDDRGVRRPILRTDSAYRNTVRRWKALPPPRWSVALFICASCVFGVGIVLEAIGVHPVALIILGTGLLGLVCFGLYVLGTHHYRALRHNSRCPTCLYDLAGLDPEPDGCTVCPECSAAWRLNAEDRKIAS